jgi:hypothetical protein
VTGGGEGAGGPPLIIRDLNGKPLLVSPDGWPGLILPTPGEPVPAFDNRAIVGHPFVQSILVRAPGLRIASLEGLRPANLTLDKLEAARPYRLVSIMESWPEQLQYGLDRAVGQLRVELHTQLRAGAFILRDANGDSVPLDLFDDPPDMVWRELGWALRPEQQPEQYALPPSPKLPSLIGLRLWPVEASPGVTGDGGADDARPWLRLRDAPGWFIRAYGSGEGDATLWRDLLLEVQERPVAFRLRISAPDGMVSDETKWVDITPKHFPNVDWIVCDWVSGKPGDKERLRFPLEVWRRAVVDFTEPRRGRLEHKRRLERLALLASAPAPKPVEASPEPVEAAGPPLVAPAADDDGGSPKALSAPPPLKHKAGLDYRASDDVLAKEIIRGVKDAAGCLLDDWDACLELAHRAEGKGTIQSKQKRLSGRVKLLRRQKSCLGPEPTE